MTRAGWRYHQRKREDEEERLKMAQAALNEELHRMFHGPVVDKNNIIEALCERFAAKFGVRKDLLTPE